MHLEFFPGQRLLLHMDGTRVLGRYEAWGGPASLGNDPRMAEEPTWPGTYVIASVQPYRTATWPLSAITWGTPLKDMPAQRDVWYQQRGGKWASVSNDLKMTRDDVLQLYYKLYGIRRVPPKWVFNDFGPIAIRWFKDLNADRVLNGRERLSGQMFHTTPKNEAEHARGEAVRLFPSHGCIHLKPSERDQLLARGAFSPKTIFRVRSYDERF